MKDESKKNNQIMNELVKLRKRIKEMERSETERKRVEEELRESEKKLKIIIESVRDVSFQLSPKGFIQYISPNVKELYGYKSDELIGKHLKKTTPMSDMPKALKVLKAALSGKKVKNFEIYQKDREGKIIPVEISIAPVKKKGKIIAVQGVMRDITERKKTEDALKESEKRLWNLFITMAEGVVMMDSDGQIVLANPRAESILGLKRPEIEGRHYTSPEWKILRPNGTPMPPEEMAGPRAMKERHPVMNVLMGVRRPDSLIVLVLS